MKRQFWLHLSSWFLCAVNISAQSCDFNWFPWVNSRAGCQLSLYQCVCTLWPNSVLRVYKCFILLGQIKKNENRKRTIILSREVQLGNPAVWIPCPPSLNWFPFCAPGARELAEGTGLLMLASHWCAALNWRGFTESQNASGLFPLSFLYSTFKRTNIGNPWIA